MDANRLMERVAQGDLAAFESLYNEYARLVYGIALRVVKNETTAEDVAQSVFMTAFAAPRAFRSGNFAAWIARVTRNRAIDEVRRGSKMADLSQFAVAANEEPLEETVIANVDADQARTLLAKLPTEQRTTLELAFFGGLSHAEIAASTGTPLGRVKTRIRSALSSLRKSITVGVSA